MKAKDVRRLVYMVMVDHLDDMNLDESFFEQIRNYAKSEDQDFDKNDHLFADRIIKQTVERMKDLLE